MEEDVPECVDAQMVIEEAYTQHVLEFREFVEKTEEWLTRYNKTMAPMLLACLASSGKPSEADFQILTTLTGHAEGFARLSQQALAEYEEAYKTAKALFNKARQK